MYQHFLPLSFRRACVTASELVSDVRKNRRERIKVNQVAYVTRSSIPRSACEIFGETCVHILG